MKINCAFCHKVINKRPHQITNSKTGKLFCEKKCWYQYRTKNKELLNPNLHSLIKQMRRLREDGWTFSKIKEKLNLPHSITSIQRYCNGIQPKNIIKNDNSKTYICIKCNKNFKHPKGRRQHCLECLPKLKIYLLNEKNKYCRKCNKTLPINQFYKSKNGRPLTYCIICCNTKVRVGKKLLKQVCVDYKGGQCEECQQRFSCLGVYEFHHLDPSKKDFIIAKHKTSKFTDIIKQELDKCQLLCANCHRIIHEKITDAKLAR